MHLQKRNIFAFRTRQFWAATSAAVALSALAATITTGCLDRPVTPMSPKTSNQVVTDVIQNSIDKIDLLFMIDNSVSMADKQALLAKAVPRLVRRLVQPLCVNSNNEIEGYSQDGKCRGSGFSPEFKPLPDIHIGLISSSLGSHGGNENCTLGTDNDHARMLASVRKEPLPQWNNKGFLAWDPLAASGNPRHSPAGESNPTTFISAFASHIKAAGELGCGLEAQLESWYRFLIDPEPPEYVTVEGSGLTSEERPRPILGATQPKGIDQVILDQRKAFLRSDSLVAIVMLTDENDASIADQNLGWMAAGSCLPSNKNISVVEGSPPGTTSVVPNLSPECVKKDGADVPWLPGKGTAICATDPNNHCCEWCATAAAKDCPAHETDASCNDPNVTHHPKLRGNMVKQQYGIDWLWPVQRYVDALTKEEIPGTVSGKLFKNPLFAASSTAAGRSIQSDTVFLAGIVGVPWQDIATDDSLAPGAVLKFMTPEQMAKATPNRWDVILGDPAASPLKLPLDPLMIESDKPRSGFSPIIKANLAPITSTDAQANPANGHEFESFAQDLQYACIFKLEETRNCVGTNAPNGCDCTNSPNKPLCNTPGGSAPDVVQRYAKAYPGTRQLQVLKGVGNRAIVASICPKFPIANPNDPLDELKYGYNPAVNAIVDRLKLALGGKCLPRPLKAEANGQVPCAVVESSKGGSCNCDPKRGRNEVTTPVGNAVRSIMANKGVCDAGGNSPNCNDMCLCEIAQLSGADNEQCIKNGTPGAPGYCYVDENTIDADLHMLDECPPEKRQKLRFASNSSDNEIPARGALTYIACLGGSVSVTDPPPKAK